MINNRVVLARTAAATALKVRMASGLDILTPINIFDHLERQNVDLWFINNSTIEGIYSKDPSPTILISSDRPIGRQNYTSSHEYAHHVFRHGIKLDELDYVKRVGKDHEEYLADCFAGLFLMPKTGTANAFAKRSWKPNSASPEQILAIASYFGVGYTTLITHLEHTLRLVNSKKADELHKVPLKEMKAEILGDEITGNLILVDMLWEGISVDLHAEDYVILPRDIDIEGTSVEAIETGGNRTVVVGRKPGISRVYHKSGWAVFVRVARKKYAGRSIYRHLDDDENIL